MAKRRAFRPQKMFGNMMVCIVIVVVSLALFNYFYNIWLPEYPG